jgi:hypothetical protein
MRCAVSAVFALALHLAAGAQQPIVRGQLQPTQGIMVGQPVRLTVTVLVPNYFTGSPDFPEFEIDNAIVVLPQDRPQNMNDHIGGVTYAGITETYTIYPQQPGTFQLPHAEITVSYASAPPKSTTAHVSLPFLTFHADVPAEARNLDYFLPTTQLTMREKWSRPLTHVQTGDSIERTITVTATKMQAMVIPPLPLDAPNGIRVYPDQPVVQDQKSERGEFLAGHRVQSAKYFIEKEGDYSLPAIELKWWNLSTKHLVTATLPPVHFTANKNPNFVAELPPAVEPVSVQPVEPVSFWRRYRFWIRVALPILVICLLALFVGCFYAPRILRRIREWHKQRDVSEPACFRRFTSACSQNDATRAYPCLLKWVSISSPGESVQDFLSRAADPALTLEMERLGEALFAPGKQNEHWQGARLASLVKKHRSSLVSEIKPRLRLVNLNP